MNSDLEIYCNSVVEVTHLTHNRCSAFIFAVNSCIVTKKSAVARFFVSRHELSQWLPVTKIMNFRKNHSYLLHFLLILSTI